MNLFQMLLKTYEYAESENLVDRLIDPKIPTIMPLYHSNRKSAGKLDIVELTISKDGKYVDGRFLDKDEYIVFPVTEESAVRTANSCPHPLFDNFEYVAGTFVTSPKKRNKDRDKHEDYLENLEPFIEYEKEHPNPILHAIFTYVKNGDVKKDVLDVIKKTTDGEHYSIGHSEENGIIDEDKIYWDKEEKGKIKRFDLALDKIFVTIHVEIPGIITRSQLATNLHQYYVDYVEHQIETKIDNVDFCDISGEKQYCVFTHRGIIGNAKVIGISNHIEAYRGRFETGEEIVHVGYRTSQKVHNMLKFLMDSKSFSQYIGGSSYVISWMSHDLLMGGMPIAASQVEPEDEENDEDENVELETSSPEIILGANRSKTINEFLSGLKTMVNAEVDSYFCVLMVEKVNNGRIAIKYFRSFHNSDLKKRVEYWFNGLEWPVYSMKDGRMKSSAPSLYTITNILIGDDSEKGISVKKESVRVNLIERLMECMLEGKIFPRDLMQLSFKRVKNTATFRFHQSIAHRTTCSLIKKYKTDLKIPVVDKKGEIFVMDNRSFTYGRILAVFDQLESYAMTVKKKGGNGESSARPTNANRLWTSMIQSPQKTSMELQKRTEYARAFLLKSHKGFVIHMEQILSELFSKLTELTDEKDNLNRPVNEDFILGFYYQKQQFFAKKVLQSEDDKVENQEN